MDKNLLAQCREKHVLCQPRFHKVCVTKVAYLIRFIIKCVTGVSQNMHLINFFVEVTTYDSIYIEFYSNNYIKNFHKKAPQVEVLTGFVFANIVWCLNNELTLMIF